MARQSRIVVPGQAMHIVQRGNNRQATFYAEEDYRKYLDTLFRSQGVRSLEKESCHIDTTKHAAMYSDRQKSVSGRN